MKNKRVVLLSLIIAVMAVQFWSGSRYPSLNEKATMGGEIRLEDPLGFDIVVPVDRSDPVWLKIGKTTINWAKTNKRGMTFGVLFAAALMSIFSILQKRAYKSSIMNSTLGIMIGAPLGVCVNCVTPIAQGIHTAGARLETTLATLISSPTLNMIVVTMLFALFPPYFVFIKLGLTITFILFGIPLIAKFCARYAMDDQLEDLTISEEACPIDLMTPIDPNESWLDAGKWTFKAYFQNLWWILRTTLPLMALAGFLGAVMITVVPWETMATLFEGHGGLENLIGEFGVALVGICVIAGVGIFLPVPIAFDVLIVAILFGAGMPPHYAMALLFTLGIFSVYPLTVIWKDISKQVAMTMTVVLTVLGVLSGLIAMGYHRWDTDRRTALFLEVFKDAEVTEHDATPPPRSGIDGDELAVALAPSFQTLQTSFIAGDLLVQQRAFEAREGEGDLVFKKVDGVDLGINEPWDFSLNRFNRPYEYHRAVASGDVHNDGWSDLVITSDNYAISLYANMGGTHFELQQVDLPALEGAFISLVALVDVDDDGWLDLFITTYLRGNWVVYNDEGRFGEDRLAAIPNTDAVMTAAASFADLDKDGDLDIALGNWSRWQRLPESQNALLMNDGGQFGVQPLPGMFGETLSALFTDFNSDGNIDLVIGNDFSQPDVFYEGDGTGALSVIKAESGLVPHTTETTMSIASADLDNDLKTDLYFTQVTGRSTNTEHVRQVEPLRVCDALADEELRNKCLEETRLWNIVRTSKARRDTMSCMRIEDPEAQADCVVHHVLSVARWTRDVKQCDFLPAQWKDLARQCRMQFEQRAEYTDEEYAKQIPQIRNYNVLLMPRDDQPGFDDLATDMNIIVTGWTWNAKFADLDNDGWQDLFAVNGLFESQTRESNYLYRNNEGTGFSDVSVESGITDYFPTSAYTYVDFDNDGDMDMIAVPIHGPVWVYENRSTSGNSIDFELRDLRGNRFGIGSKIVIRYGDGLHQMREFQSGGGFISFDAPIAHFGLGEAGQVTSVEIEWSTSERTEIQGDFSAGSLYRITRPAAGSDTAANVPLADGDAG